MAMATGNTAQCNVCGQDFTSRNKLFKHLNDSGHGVVASQSDKKSGKAKGDAAADGKGADGNTSGNSSQHQPHLSKGNDAYYEYYLRQKICNDEKSWKEAYHRLRTPLPISYRIHESSPISEFSVQLLELIDKVQSDRNGKEREKNQDDDALVTDDKEQIFQQWSFNTEERKDEDDAASIPKIRMAVTPNFHHRSKSSRKNKSNDEDDESDVYSPLLHALQELGAIHRQEIVSAIPPLALWATCSKDKGEHNSDGLIVADLCAAPGSKSLQILDMLYSSTTEQNKIPSGLLVVNDSDRNRIITLCQRSRHVPRGPMLAINMDARYFPGMRRRCNWNGNKICDDAVGTTNVREKSGYKQKYDKVLCDVPCSGDGTTRKNKQVWNTWSIGHAMSLHRLQRKILRRAMELLRPGGVVVYSTCSLNPLENEAVVASVIEDVGGVKAMEIVPLPEWLVQKCGSLKGLKGTWQVPHPKFGKKGMSDMYKSYNDVPIEHQGGGSKEKGKKGGQINQSMFPPENNPELLEQLSHCGRFIPGPGLDSGGFFVACIRRLHVGELESNGTKEKTTQSTKIVSSETALEEPVHTMTTTKNENDATVLSEAKDLEPSTTNNQSLREGDWICASCKEINFARRGGSKCFSCKVRKPHALLQKEKEEKVNKPLLGPLSPSELQAFLEFFGIQAGPESPFPLDNVYIIRRSKENVFVVVSDSLSKLNISDNWSPVRELGITLASYYDDTHEFRLYDEGLPILVRCATKRHFKLETSLFQNALAQSVRLLLESSTVAEVERVKATIDRSELAVDGICDKDMWYDALPESMVTTWAQCKAEPGCFIVSCECKILGSAESIGHFSFCGSIDAQGNVDVKTSLRVAAAMLVVLHKYSEVCSSGLPVSKRRKI